MRSRLYSDRKQVFQIGRFSFYAADLLALLVFAAMGVFFFVTAKYGITEADEAFYHSVSHRLMLGDKLLADECYVTDLTAVFWYLPYRVFYALLGAARVSFSRCGFYMPRSSLSFTSSFTYVCGNTRIGRFWLQ